MMGYHEKLSKFHIKKFENLKKLFFEIFAIDLFISCKNDLQPIKIFFYDGGIMKNCQNLI